MAQKYLDYAGLKKYNEELASNVLGTGFSIANQKATIKEYIDSRIFVGTEAEVELALQAKLIDSTTFTVIEEPDATEATSIAINDITSLFN